MYWLSAIYESLIGPVISTDIVSTASMEVWSLCLLRGAIYCAPSRQLEQKCDRFPKVYQLLRLKTFFDLQNVSTYLTESG